MSFPPLPIHPERLTQRWSEEEIKVLQAYGQACREQAMKEAAQAALDAPIKSATQPIREACANAIRRLI